MASPGGTSTTGTGSSVIQRQSSSDSEQEEMPHVMDERKRKRMLSNRESARRSRMKKQKHLDDLMGQVTNLRKENSQILTNMNLTTQHYLKIEAENSVLKAQMDELKNRLDSLNEIIGVMNGIGNAGIGGVTGCGGGSSGAGASVTGGNGGFGGHHEDVLGGSVGSSDGSSANQYFGSVVGDAGFTNMNHWNSMYLNQPIMAEAAAAEIYQY